MTQVKAQTEARQTYLCPRFEGFIFPGGFCKLDRLPRDDNYTLLSCLFDGDAKSCLNAHTDVSEKLKAKLEKRVKRLETGAEYFKKILKETAYFPIRTLSPAELVKNGMDRLAEYEGEAEIILVQGGKVQSPQKVILKKFNPKDGCLFFGEGNASIPIMGSGTAVQRVTDKDGNVPYVNTEVDETYSPNNFNEIRIKCGLKPLLLCDTWG